MTQIEMDACRALVRACSVYVREEERVNWGQRRYEVARNVMPECIRQVDEVLKGGGSLIEPTFARQVAKMAINYADVFLRELAKRPTNDFLNTLGEEKGAEE